MSCVLRKEQAPEGPVLSHFFLSLFPLVRRSGRRRSGLMSTGDTTPAEHPSTR